MSEFNFSPSRTVYEDMYQNEDSHWWYKGLRDLIKSEISNLKISRVLDAGCGTGRNLELLNSLNLKAYGIDISSEALKFCQLKNLTNLKKANLLETGFEDSFFDLITCLDVFGNLNISQANIALEEFSRITQPNGYVVLNTSAFPWMFSSHDKAWDIKKRYYLEELEDLFKKNGFQIIRGTYRVTFLFPLILFLRSLEKFHKNTSDRGDTHKTNLILNILLYKIMQLENFCLRFMNLPFGNSVFIVAKKITL
jgi:SAM-dependent methyltransferase